MKLNVAVPAAQLDIARGPRIGEDVVVSFAPEPCQLLGSIRATAAAVGAYTSAGGSGIPTGGRDLFVRVSSMQCAGVAGSAMAITFNVVLDDDSNDTAVATFHIPTWATAQGNIMPFGVASDLIPATVGNVGKKVKTLGTLVSVANMVAGNQFEVLTSPNVADFVEIEGCRGKGGALSLPKVLNIGAGREAVWKTKLGRGDVQNLKIEFVNRGMMEQLNRFTGHKGTILFDYIMDGVVLAQRTLYSGFWPQPLGDTPDTGENVVTAEGPYEKHAIGYLRVS